MARRREGMAPYEIMGSTTQGGSAPAAEPAEPAVARRTLGESVRELWDAGVPVVVRVPRGFAVLICVGVLGLIVLSYWVGYSRGRSAAEAELAEEVAELERAVGRAPRLAGGRLDLAVPDLATRGAGDEAFSGRSGGIGRAGDAGGSGASVLRPGLNYLVLARYPRKEAERLSAFLSSRGVETAVVPTDNGEFFHVVGLRGFTTEEYRSGEQAAYERMMKQLGRDWKAFNAGRGHNLSDMYWKLYTGPQ